MMRFLHRLRAHALPRKTLLGRRFQPSDEIRVSAKGR